MPLCARAAGWVCIWLWQWVQFAIADMKETFRADRPDVTIFIFLGVPKDFEEAAVIDGASQIAVFARVYLPLVTPALAVLAMLVFNGTWNDFFRPLIFINDPLLFTIPLGLNDLKGYMATGSISVVLAGVTMSLIPVVIVYIFGQRYLIEGIMMGGVKG